MTANREQYRPPLIGERLAPPLTLCRAAATGMAWAMCTLGESVTRQDGRPFGNPIFRERLIDARNNTGEPDRAGYNQSHMDAFLKAWGSPLKLKDVKFNKKRADIREALKNHNAITMAGSTVGTPISSALRRWVNPVGHEIIFFDWEGGWRTGTVAFIDTMTPTDSIQWVRRVPVREMWQFGDYFASGGYFIAEKWRIGQYTKAAVATRASASLVVQAQKRLLSALKEHEAVSNELDEVILKYNRLDVNYQILKDEHGVDATVEAEVAAKLEAALSQLLQR